VLITAYRRMVIYINITVLNSSGIDLYTRIKIEV